MAGIRLSNSENSVILRALTVYRWYLRLPEDERASDCYCPLKPSEEEEELVMVGELYDRAYWNERKRQRY